MQTSDKRLRKKALTEGSDFNALVKLGCTLETTDKQAVEMSQAEQVRNVGSGPKQKNASICDNCGYERERAHSKGSCPAKGKKCAACNGIGHFAKTKLCKGSQKVRNIGSNGNQYKANSDTDSGSDSDNDVGRVIVGSVNTETKVDDEVVKFT